MGRPMAEMRPPDIQVEMFSQPRLLASARAMVGSIAQWVGFDDVQCGQVSLAVDEALCNVINHGYERRDDGRIWISLWATNVEPPGIRIVIEDLAKQIDPDKIRSRDLDDIRPGGLGVFIIREIMDDVKYERRAEGGMRLSMAKQLTSNAKGSQRPITSASCESEPDHE